MTQPTIIQPESLVELDRGWRVWPLAALRSAGLPFTGLDQLAATAVLAQPPGPARHAALREQALTAVDHLLSDEQFRAALTWQNPTAVDNWVARWVAGLRTGQRPALGRIERRQAFVARYAQRYCAKNDTIGFFGPVAWASLGKARAAQHGNATIRRRRAHFELWAISALARVWERHPALADHLPASLDPACLFDGERLHRPRRTPMTLTEAEAAVAAALAAGGSVAEVTRRSGLARVEALGGLERLRAAGAVRIGFRLPPDGAPERRLRRYLDQIPPEAGAERLRQTLDRLEAARADAEHAVDPERLSTALATVESRLAEAVGHPLAPPPGRDLGGRTPIYLDCRRHLDVDIAEADLAGLRAPLGILLDSARWLAGQVGAVLASALSERYAALAASREVVTLADLQFAAADLLRPSADQYAEVVADFHLRWAEITALGVGSPVRAPVDRARRMADALFPETGRRWAAARVHSPDLMLRRMPDGTLRWVLGELHIALNTLESRVFLDQADDGQRLRDLVAADMAAGRVVPVYPNDSPDVTSRTYPPLALDPDHGYRYWSYGSDDGHPRGASSTPASALLVRSDGHDLVATCETDGWAAPVLECFGEFVTALVVNLFRICPPRRHTPRVELGDLTIQRETWRFAPEEFGGVSRLAVDPGHDALRTWAARRHLPRHVFVRVPNGSKPFYVDFDAPALVDGLAQAVRRVTRQYADGDAGQPGWVELVEMLPSPDELWLRLDGRRYTSELRMVAVDPVPAQPAWWPIPRPLSAPPVGATASAGR